MSDKKEAWKQFCKEAIPHAEEIRRLADEYGFPVISFWVHEDGNISLDSYGDAHFDCFEYKGKYSLHEFCTTFDIITGARPEIKNAPGSGNSEGADRKINTWSL